MRHFLIIFYLIFISCNTEPRKKSLTKVQNTNNNVKINSVAKKKEFDYWLKYIDLNKLGKEHKEADELSEQFTKYLGKIKLKNADQWHVISQFSTLQMAIVKKGYSRIVLLNDKANLFKKYNLSMPYELPLGIVDNQLQFVFDKEQYYLTIDTIGEIICLPNEEGCYGNY